MPTRRAARGTLESGASLPRDRVEALAVAARRRRPGGDSRPVELAQHGDERRRLADVLREAEKRHAARARPQDRFAERGGGRQRAGLPESAAKAAASTGWRRSRSSAVSSCPGTNPFPIIRSVGLARPSAPRAAAEKEVAMPKKRTSPSSRAQST